MNEPTMRRGVLALGGSMLAMPGVAKAALMTPTPALPVAGSLPRRTVRQGVVIAYQDEWFGPQWQVPEPMVMFHGVAESHLAWQQWVPVVGSQFRIIRPDLPGFGQSPLPDGYACTVAQAAGDLLRLLDALHIDRFHLVGAKAGGSIALQMAADHSDRVKTLTVLGTPAKGAPGGKADLTAFPELIRKEGVRGWASATMRSRLGSEASPEMLAWWTDELMGRSDPRSCIGYSAAVGAMDLEPILGRITSPTLVVTTESSPLQTVASARAYQERIPHSKLLVMSGDSYHIAAVRPVECARVVADFATRA